MMKFSYYFSISFDFFSPGSVHPFMVNGHTTKSKATIMYVSPIPHPLSPFSSNYILFRSRRPRYVLMGMVLSPPSPWIRTIWPFPSKPLCSRAASSCGSRVWHQAFLIREMVRKRTFEERKGSCSALYRFVCVYFFACNWAKRPYSNILMLFYVWFHPTTFVCDWEMTAFSCLSLFYVFLLLLCFK